jgi:hypothetical protein
MLAKQRVYMNLAKPDPAREERRVSLAIAEEVERLKVADYESILREVRKRKIKHDSRATKLQLAVALASHIVHSGVEYDTTSTLNSTKQPISNESKRNVPKTTTKAPYAVRGQSGVKWKGSLSRRTAHKGTEGDGSNSVEEVFVINGKLGVDESKEAEMQAQLVGLLQQGSFDAMLGRAVGLGKQRVIDLLRYREQQRMVQGVTSSGDGAQDSATRVEDTAFASLSSLATQLVDSLLIDKQQGPFTQQPGSEGRREREHMSQVTRRGKPQMGSTREDFDVRDIGGLWFEQELLRRLIKKAAAVAGNSAIVAQDIVFGSLLRTGKLFWQPFRLRRLALFETVLSRGVYASLRAFGSLCAGLLLRLGSWAGGELLTAGQVLAYTGAYAVFTRRGVRGWLTALGVVKVVSSLVLPPPAAAEASTEEAGSSSIVS